MLLTRFEMARLIGIRAMQLEEGALPGLQVENVDLRADAVYVAGRELESGTLDACVRRGEKLVHVRDISMPQELATMLNGKDGGRRRAYRPD